MVPPEAASMPQEIDGKGGENPPLCRNRVASSAYRDIAQPECQPGESPTTHGGDAPPHQRPNTEMNKQTKAPAGSSIRIVPALLLAGLSPAAPAEQPPITELAPITVSAHGGSSIPYDSTGVSVTVLDVEELREEGITYLD